MKNRATWKLGCDAFMTIHNYDKMKEFLIVIEDAQFVGNCRDIVVEKHAQTLRTLKRMVAWMEERM